jgi:hypothetical protein
MQRREATLVFREICERMPDAFFLNSVSLKPKNNSASPEENYELWIRAFLDPDTLKRINSIVKKHNLMMNGQKDSVIIYAPEFRPMEIIA